MKKILLSISTLALALTANAQLSANGDGFKYLTKNAASLCYVNLGFPGTAGQLNGDQATFQTMQLTAEGLVLTSKATLPAPENATAAWFPFTVVTPGVIGDGTDDQCQTLFEANKSINISNQSKISVRVKSSIAPATFEFFIGSKGQWGPATSSFSKDITASGVITEANVEQVLYFDLATIGGNKWTNWAEKNEIQSLAFRTGTADAVFTVINVLVGSEAGDPVSTNKVVAKSLNVYPNPVSNVLTVEADLVAASSVELVDLSGKLVATQSVGAGFNKVQFNVANVNAGLYFLSVRSANGVVTQKVIVK
jgi:hypothetical protein